MEEQSKFSNPELTDALKQLSREWGSAGQRWLVGGSCGLWLQGVDLQTKPRDIDVYADVKEAAQLHEILLPRSIDRQVMDKSGMYVSLLSHYNLGSYVLELVGGFEVKTNGSHYRVEVGDILYPYASSISLGPLMVLVMPLSHEFLFNVLRDRPDRYIPIAESIKQDPESHLTLLRDLITRNQWSDTHLLFIEKLLGDRGFLNGH